MLYTLLLSAVIAAGPDVARDSLHFTPFEVDAGLSQSSVYALAQDSLGFLWVGTHDGLDRFDGVEFVSHRVPKGRVLDNRIQVLVADGSRLWVLSHGGLHLRDQRRGTVRLVRASTVMGGLAARRDGGVWVGVQDSVVAVDVHGGLRSAWRVPAVVRVLHEDTQRRLWIGTTDGLYALIRGRLHGPWRRGQDVLALAEPMPGTVWVGTAQSAFEIRDPGRTRVLLREGVGAFAVAGGRGWAATRGGRLFALTDPNTAPREIRLPFRRTIAALLRDRAGILWIGTDGGGLVRVDSAVRPARALRPGPSLSASNFITSLAETPDGQVWVGSPTGGPHLIDRNGRLTNVSPWPLMGDIRGFFVDGQGRLWAGTRNGLWVRTDEGFTPVPIPWLKGGPQSVRALAEDAGGGLWVAAGNNLYHRPSGGSFRSRTHDLQGLADVLALHTGASGDLWAVTRCGDLLRLGRDGRIERLHETVGCRMRANALVEDEAGMLWMATSDGLYTLDPATAMLQSHSLPLPMAKQHPYLYSLLRDAAGRFWMGTNSGLIRYDPAAGTVRRFTRADGLPSEEFNAGAALQTSDGRLIFGTVNGLAVFGPDHLHVPETGPPVTFTAFTRFDEPVTDEPDVNLRDRLVLRPGQTVFSLRFAALGLDNPAHARYRYRMDVLDSAWVEAGAGREARYTNLPTGTHTFFVQAAGDEGVWGPERQLAIVVVPPLWQRPWVLGLGAVLGIGALFLVARTLTTRRLRRRLQAMELEQRVVQELEQERARIAADVHDQVGATLTQIKLLSEVARARTAGGAPATLLQIERAAQSAVEELDAIVWALDATHDGLEHFSGYLCAQAETLCAQADLALRLDLPPSWPEGHLPATVRHPVFLAVREALCNSVRHARARTLHLRFSADAARVAIEVVDDGVGFDAADANPFGHGLVNMRRRVEGVGGTCTLTTAPGAGTCVRFELTVREAQFASLGNGFS